MSYKRNKRISYNYAILMSIKKHLLKTVMSRDILDIALDHVGKKIKSLFVYLFVLGLTQF